MAPPAAIESLPETDTTTFTVPDPLKIQDIAKRRAASGKLIAGVAAVADVDAFKGKTQHLHKPKAKRWDCMYLPCHMRGVCLVMLLVKTSLTMYRSPYDRGQDQEEQFSEIGGQVSEDPRIDLAWWRLALERVLPLRRT
jgi:hypothetical protein